MSLVLRQWPPLVPIVGALAVADVAAAGGATITIKWPNDVLLDDRKLAGVLGEARPQEGWCVLGIGLNVAVRVEDLPPELHDRAATLGLRPTAVEPTLDALLRALEQRLAQPTADALDELRALDALHGRRVRWAEGEGVACGIDDEGRLLVQGGATGPVALAAGEVHLLAGPLVVRRAVGGEAGELTALVLRSKAVWGYDPQFMRRAAAELLVSDHDIAERDVFVAQVGDVLAGVSGIDHAAQPPELDLLFVDPIHKGTGVGRALLRHTLAAARVRGLKELVIVSDPYAEPFYLSQGAVRVGARRSSSTGRELPLLRIATDVAR